MFTKSFVSVFFTQSKVYALLMDNSKKRALRYGSADVPPGIIVNHRVAKPAELAAVLKTLWKSSKIGEKTVGLVVPEFATYTKLITLPPLEHRELDEAVRWQWQDFMPDNAVGMVLDWSIVSRTQDGVTVLATSIQNDVLADYVGVVSSAGLMPLVVETPSISIARIADGDDKGRLIIYVAQAETILVITKGETVVASSIASSASQQEIITGAVRMVQHYSSVKIDEVKVGGASLSQQFLDNLKQSLGSNVILVDHKVEGLDVRLVQEYLIPISLQLKDPAAPDDETTINLLPESWVKLYREEHRNLQVWTLSLVASIVLWSCFLFVFISYMLMIRELDSLRKESLPVVEAGAQISEEVNTINALTKQVISVKEGERQPQNYIKAIKDLAPAGIEITTYRYNIEKGTFTVRGQSEGRDALVNFKSALESNEDISSLDIPLSNFVFEGSQSFEINFNYGVPVATAQPRRVRLQE